MKNPFELKHKNHDLKGTWRFANATCTVYKLLFLKKTDLCLFHCHKNLKITFAQESKC